jgi:CRP-like cAMP-binding protein
MITLRQYAAGEIIFRENDPGESAYIIERGRVEVTKTLDGQSIHLAYLGPGEPCGEMGMIDDKPRSATVMAVEETVVRELHRDHFFHSLRTNPEVALSLLKVLFERLREADATILRLHKMLAPSAPPPSVPPLEAAATADLAVFLEGLTPQAARALPVTPFQITTFPFRIGRQSDDPLVHNDLALPDTVPLHVSRHHLTLIKHAGRIGATDRGSRLGSLVDGQRVGGLGGDPGPCFFAGPEGTLVLGNRHSPFRYKVIIKAEGQRSGAQR